MNSVRSINISFKYERCTTLGFKDIGIINSEFVAKTQFLSLSQLNNSTAVCDPIVNALTQQSSSVLTITPFKLMIETR